VRIGRFSKRDTKPWKFQTVPECVKGSRTCLRGRLDSHEGDQTDEWPQDESTSFAHPVGHDGQECGTTDSWQVENVTGTEYQANVEDPAQNTSTDNGDEDGNRSSNSSLLDFLTDMCGY
jgi:hypothetical protein